MGEMRNALACKMLVSKSESKTPLRRPRRRWKDNFKMDFKEIGYESVNWIQVAQDRVQWRTLVNFGFHKRQGIY
jgi:hypothetical protein